MCVFIYIYVYTHVCTYVCVYICTHTHIHIHIYIYLKGSLTFLPISQSEGPTEVVCVLVEMDPGLTVSGSSVKCHLRPRQGRVCAEREGLSMALPGPPRRSGLLLCSFPIASGAL